MIGGVGVAVAGGGAIELARLVEVARYAVAGLEAQGAGEILGGIGARGGTGAFNESAGGIVGAGGSDST